MNTDDANRPYRGTSHRDLRGARPHHRSMPATVLLRGHDFLPSPEDLAAIPDLYATEDVPVAEKTVHLHYFIGSCDWWIVELSKDRTLAFGYVNLGDDYNAEWGYIDMDELRGLVATRGMTPGVVERDLYWHPTLVGNVQRIGS